MKKLLFIMLISSLQACKTHENTGNTGVNAEQCKTVQQKCVSGVYDEWYQKNGDISCSCFGKTDNPEPNL